MNEKSDPFDVDTVLSAQDHEQVVKEAETRNAVQEAKAAEMAGARCINTSVVADMVPTSTPKYDSRTEWMSKGKCREVEHDMFFPSDGVGVSAAQRVCSDCPVKEPCLEYALFHRIDHGVWGGASERERRRILRIRRIDNMPTSPG
jgi:WhiB family transcriptional regulator, redox-sensing transcriptional regulator